MKRLSLTFLLFSALILGSCKDNNKNEDNDMNTDMNSDSISQMDNNQKMQDSTKKVTVTLQPVSGSNLSGNVVFTEENGEVTMNATIDGLSQGMHAIHIHENADCSADDGTSAGGHWNPTNEQHGKWGSADGYHKGDIGNFDVDKDGHGTITMTTNEWCIGCGDSNKDILGHSIIVHEGADDFTSQPSGAAGKRVGCGAIKKD